jgi:hypothetical protein
VRSGPGAVRTILRFHTISARPSKEPLMVRTFLKVYGAGLLFFVSAGTDKRHHHHGKGFCRGILFQRVSERELAKGS